MPSHSWLPCLLALCFAACSGKDDPAAAGGQLDKFLDNPVPGERFGDFVTAWKNFAPLDSLAPEIERRLSQVGRPADTAALLLTRALFALHLRDYEAARSHFSKLADAPGFPELMTTLAGPKNPALIPDLVDAIERAFIDRLAARDGVALDALEDESALRAVVGAIAESPRCLWALREELRERPWFGDRQADLLLDTISGYKDSERVEQVFDFLLHSPLVADPAGFDPVALTDRERDTLLELFLLRFAQSGKRRGGQLAKLLHSHTPQSFGAELLAIQLDHPGESSAATARLYQQNIAAFSTQSADRSRSQAALASRLTRGLSEADALADRPLSAFHDWLASHALQNAGLDPARFWLDAKSWDELPGDAGDIIARVQELLDTLLARDPGVATELLVHVSRLHHDSLAPEDSANRVGSIGATVLANYIHQKPTAKSRAFALNTFVAGKGEIGWSMGQGFSGWTRSDLTNALYQKKPLEPRYVDCFQRLKELSDHVRIPDRRILVTALREFSNSLPLNDVSVTGFLARIEAEIEQRQSDPAPDLAYLDALRQTRLSVLLRQRQLAGRACLKDDPEEQPYLDAIRDSEQDWCWRFALASALLESKFGPMSGDFVRESASLLMDGYRQDLLVHLEGESNVVAALQKYLARNDDPALRKDFVAAWRERIDRTKRIDIFPEVMIRMLRMALDAGDEDAARRVLRGTSHPVRRPSALIAAINAGASDIAADLLANNHQFYDAPPEYQERDSSFDVNVEDFLAALRALPAHYQGLETYDRESIALQARALFHVTPGRPNTPATKAEAADIAAKITEIYRAVDEPPAPVERALLLMAHDPASLARLGEALDRWMVLYGVKELLRTGSSRATEEIATIHHHAKTRLSVPNDRDTESILDLLNEFPNLIIACALAERCDQLGPWWEELPADHQKYLSTEANEGLGSVFNATGRLGKGSKALQADPELKKRFAVEVLKAPAPAAGADFAGPWIYRGLASAEELLAWAPDLIAGAERRGCTAFTLGKVARDRLEKPEVALALFDQALGSDKKYQSDEAIFRIERALTMLQLGRSAEAAADLRAYQQSERYLESYSTKVEQLLAELEAVGAKQSAPDSKPPN